LKNKVAGSKSSQLHFHLTKCTGNCLTKYFKSFGVESLSHLQALHFKPKNSLLGKLAAERWQQLNINDFPETQMI
jgi:hypothetical protein